MDFWAMAAISAGVCWTWGECEARERRLQDTRCVGFHTHRDLHTHSNRHTRGWALRAFMRVDAASKTRRAPAVQGAAASGTRWRQWPFPQGQVQEGTSALVLKQTRLL